MIQLAEKKLCTGCGACASVCPQHSIVMEENVDGIIYPVINHEKCVKCQLCEKICPIKNPTEKQIPHTCYAAWNNNPDKRKTSASGGIAIAIYEKALSLGYKCVGASQNPDFSVTHKIVFTPEELRPFKNSKYVFSQAYEIFSQVKYSLKAGEEVVVIGLPCQIAAFRRMFSDLKGLLLVDIVCHGCVPTTYLQQHIKYLEKKSGQKASYMSFRAPEKGTATYHFTLYNNTSEIFYSKRTSDGDLYNYGFHRGISYRENCYHCFFARPERVSDITLGDFHGLGKLSPCSYGEDKVSVILINTIKGDLFVKDLIKCGMIHADLRPVDEPLQGDFQLQRPSPKSQMRLDFEKLIKCNHCDFESTMYQVVRRQQMRERMERIKVLPSMVLKKWIKIMRK